jgi:hypothetical protein
MKRDSLNEPLTYKTFRLKFSHSGDDWEVDIRKPSRESVLKRNGEMVNGVVSLKVFLSAVEDAPRIILEIEPDWPEEKKISLKEDDNERKQNL